MAKAIATVRAIPPRVVLATLVASFVVTSSAHAASVACNPTLCTTSAPNDCTVSSTKTITPGDEIDCTGRNVVVTSSGKIKVTDGFFKLIAATLNVQGNGGTSQGVIEAVDATGGDPIGGFEIETTGTVTVGGSLQANSAAGGGTITVNATGNISIPDNGNNGVEANGTGTDGAGGRIELSSDGSITIQDPIQANAAGSGEAVGGQIEIDAGTSVTIQYSGCSVTAEGNQADAGEIRINAGTDITIAAAVTMSADGNGEGGNGGGIYLTAQDEVSLSGPTSARGGKGVSGAEASGGTLEIESGCGGVDILGNLDLRAGESGGGLDVGSLMIDTLGDLTIGTGILIDTHAVGYGGNGGSVELFSGNKLMMNSNATIDARGHVQTSGDGMGGSVTLHGCKLETAAGATVDASGKEGGQIFLHASRADAPANVTSMKISTTSVFDSRGSTTAQDGTIWVAVGKENLSGTCSTNGQPCTLDANCTVGCTPGNCNGVNPDTGDVLTQFESTPDISEDRNLVGCATQSECAP
jgi:hypothetical protein